MLVTTGFTPFALFQAGHILEYTPTRNGNWRMFWGSEDSTAEEERKYGAEMLL